jgi:hypothetical protein
LPEITDHGACGSSGAGSQKHFCLYPIRDPSGNFLKKKPDQQLDDLLKSQYLFARNYGKKLSQLRVSRGR